MAFSEVSPQPLPGWQHRSTESYKRFLRQCMGESDGVRHALKWQALFQKTYPDLRAWFSAPLAERVGRVYDDSSWIIVSEASHHARLYLVFLVLQGEIRLDWDWLLAVSTLRIWGRLKQARIDLDLPLLTEEAVQLGYQHRNAYESLRWTLSRLFLHTGATRAAQITEQNVADLSKAVQSFKTRSDLLQFYESKEQYDMLAQDYQGCLSLLQVVLYHRGQVRSEPRKRLPYGEKEAIAQPEMPHLQATLALMWLDDKSPIVQPH
ncbi:hypothetical protein KSF_001550 [Reticulibacter mediterranei]|uniref:Uncharacterized protein n=1 Tax=Reticulibacter mediterranei TaxID=2778369 RepID=A0A8J3N0C3_9CHLR|nr:hypothetical protein [Reticulibacter mediterranei]GHO90107.1 hypothetical protein KSF_001550 [Reticulibacter mediterranei]